MTRLLLTVFLVATVVGCTATPDRYAVTLPDITSTQPIAFGLVEVREVSLPAYAAADEISVRNEDGRVVSSGSVLWADTPDRSLALELSRALVQITSARVASAPWPFESFPDARLDVRFETLVAGSDGQYRARGQYFVAVTDGRRERAGLFDVSTSFDPEAGPQAIAAARGQIIAELALYIARNGLR